MTGSNEVLLWSGVAFALAALAVPWFLWGSGPVIAGLPVWIWWHVGWLGLTSVAFVAFARTAWGLGVESRGGVDG